MAITWQGLDQGWTAVDSTAIACDDEVGKVDALNDGSYPLVETPEAIQYLQEGHARGKIVVSI